MSLLFQEIESCDLPARKPKEKEIKNYALGIHHLFGNNKKNNSNRFSISPASMGYARRYRKEAHDIYSLSEYMYNFEEMHKTLANG